ncbi:MAG: cupin domain-containing protein [Actinomycetota bacterium]
MAERGTRDIWFEGVFMRVQVSTDDTAGAISMMEQWLPAHWSPPLHVHRLEDQVLYLLEGEMRAQLHHESGVEEQVVVAGESAFLPRGVPHTFLTGPEGAKLLEINTPGGFEQFHVDAGDVATEAVIPPASEVDVPKLVAAIQPYEAEFIGPPMTV